MTWAWEGQTGDAMQTAVTEYGEYFSERHYTSSPVSFA